MEILCFLFSASDFNLKSSKNLPNTGWAFLSEGTAHILKVWKGEFAEHSHFICWNNFQNIFFIYALVKIWIRLSTCIITPKARFEHMFSLNIKWTTIQLPQCLEMRWEIYFNFNISFGSKHGVNSILINRT
jgi:hypothetical protein